MDKESRLAVEGRGIAGDVPEEETLDNTSSNLLDKLFGGDTLFIKPATFFISDVNKGFSPGEHTFS